LGVLACFVASLPLLRRLRSAFIVLGNCLGLLAIGAEIILPNLDRFTEGKLVERFSRPDGAGGREDIAKSDLKIWMKYPVMGAGVGNSYSARREFLGHAAFPHTEYTRLLAEHGLFGLAAGLILLWILFRASLLSLEPLCLSIKGGVLIFGLLFMAVSATRLVLPALLFGIVTAFIVPPPRIRQIRSPIHTRCSTIPRRVVMPCS
jgi:hypothetical protein